MFNVKKNIFYQSLTIVKFILLIINNCKKLKNKTIFHLKHFAFKKSAELLYHNRIKRFKICKSENAK